MVGDRCVIFWDLLHDVYLHPSMHLYIHLYMDIHNHYYELKKTVSKNSEVE